MYKKVFSLIIVFSLAVNYSALADVSDNTNSNTTNVVTEYYSSDLYNDIEDVTAIPVSSPPEITAESAVLMEASTGKILYEKDKDKKVFPASITKIMTMLLIVEAIESKKLSFDDKVTTSEHAASMGGSQIWLEVGETMTVHDLMKAVAVGSANDASVALGEHIAGSEEGFVSMMNQKAKQLGMSNTNFQNACGLDDTNHITTANDVAIMSKELIKHDVIKQYTTIWMDSVRNETVQLVNTNKLVRFYRGATGLKTGTTDKAGCCLSATAKRNNMELVAVVMGAKSSQERFSFSKKLLDYGFANWCTLKPKIDKKIPDFINVKEGQSRKVNISAQTIENQLISLNDKENIKTQIVLNEQIEAPFEKNTMVGEIKIILGKKVINKYKITTDYGVEKINFSFSFAKLLKSIVSL